MTGALIFREHQACKCSKQVTDGTLKQCPQCCAHNHATETGQGSAAANIHGKYACIFPVRFWRCCSLFGLAKPTLCARQWRHAPLLRSSPQHQRCVGPAAGDAVSTTVSRDFAWPATANPKRRTLKCREW